MAATIGTHGGVVSSAPSKHTKIVPGWSHPEVIYWHDTWMQIRDCQLGEQEIKQKGTTYLGKMPEMDEDEYQTYLDNAVFFNMTERTHTALVGTVFFRPPKIHEVPARLVDKLLNCVYDNGALETLLTNAVSELVALGRFGLLVDRDSSGRYDPYLRPYEAENILDWQEDWVRGRKIPVQIVLREFEEVQSDVRRIGSQRGWKIIYRVLALEGSDDAGWVYSQYVYEVDSTQADVSEKQPAKYTPTNRGVTFDTIPFEIMGAKTNTFNCDRPPFASIASLNLAHYRAYAHLEHGRFFTAMPIYYVQVSPANEKAEYVLGPSRVWECAVGEKPGILEFNGTGLKTLENSCAQKEAQIAMIGGRLMGGNAASGSESDNQASIKENNERTLLLKIINNVNAGVTSAVNTWLKWQDVVNPKAEVELNTTFLFDNLGARELRAAHAMYKEGIIPVSALHSYLQKAEVVPEWMDADEFVKLLNNMDEFPNQPDVWARMMGYADAKNKQDVRLARRDMRNTEELTEIEWEKVGNEGRDLDIVEKDVDGTLTNEQKKIKVAEKDAATRRIAANKPAPKPGVPGQVGAARTAARPKPKV